MRSSTRNSVGGAYLDTVGVAGSIPAARTIQKSNKFKKPVEIPLNWRLYLESDAWLKIIAAPPIEENSAKKSVQKVSKTEGGSFSVRGA